VTSDWGNGEDQIEKDSNGLRVEVREGAETSGDIPESPDAMIRLSKSG